MRSPGFTLLELIVYIALLTSIYFVVATVVMPVRTGKEDLEKIKAQVVRIGRDLVSLSIEKQTPCRLLFEQNKEKDLSFRAEFWDFSKNEFVPFRDGKALELGKVKEAGFGDKNNKKNDSTTKDEAEEDSKDKLIGSDRFVILIRADGVCRKAKLELTLEAKSGVQSNISIEAGPAIGLSFTA